MFKHFLLTFKKWNKYVLDELLIIQANLCVLSVVMHILCLSHLMEKIRYTRYLVAFRR